MDFEIRLARESDLDALESFYNDLNDYLSATNNYPGWKKGVYPTRLDAADGVRENCLYIASRNGDIAAAMILSGIQDPSYYGVRWQESLSDAQVLVVYTFAVSHKYQRNGVGGMMLDFACDYASARGCKALRLDVYEKNLPAIAIYEKHGFTCVGETSLDVMIGGSGIFKLFEKLL